MAGGVLLAPALAAASAREVCMGRGVLLAPALGPAIASVLNTGALHCKVPNGLPLAQVIAAAGTVLLCQLAVAVVADGAHQRGAASASACSPPADGIDALLAG